MPACDDRCGWSNGDRSTNRRGTNARANTANCVHRSTGLHRCTPTEPTVSPESSWSRLRNYITTGRVCKCQCAHIDIFFAT
ncbi:hypothetical protein M5D96_011068 [Drosophila gunungcola]|uniref:Uncharacterized protein n=1 Tax=Drosophila gunungcola TaxID=103775 RepID=A0A9P9YG72_9MUSC|nr:hypothetical protein M5D96_011068 [Drosophila gunungcola]